jgi:hypothetical protein
VLISLGQPVARLPSAPPGDIIENRPGALGAGSTNHAFQRVLSHETARFSGDDRGGNSFGNLWAGHRIAHAADTKRHIHASPAEAMRSPRETEMFVTALRVGIDPEGKDYMAVVDVDPASKTYSKVVHRVMMPQAGDELHHFGWNACASCHASSERARRYLIVPGIRSGRIHVIDAVEPRSAKMPR